MSNRVSHVHDCAAEHADNERRNGGNIARAGGKPKGGVVPVNGGMHFRTRDGEFITGLSHQEVVNAPDASGRKPLDPTLPGKIHTMAAPVIGHRGRHGDPLHGGAPGEAHAKASGPHVPPSPAFAGLSAAGSRKLPANQIDHALGQKILDEAYNAGSQDDRDTRRHCVPMSRGKC